MDLFCCEINFDEAGKQKKTFVFFLIYFFASGLLDVIDMYKRKHVLDFNTVELNNGK